MHPTEEEFWRDPLGTKLARTTIAKAIITQRWSAAALFITEAATLQYVWATWDRTTVANVGPGAFWVLGVPSLLGAARGIRCLDMLAILIGFSSSMAIALLAGAPLGSDDYPGLWYLVGMGVAYYPIMIAAHLAGACIHRAFRWPRSLLAGLLLMAFLAPTLVACTIWNNPTRTPTPTATVGPSTPVPPTPTRTPTPKPEGGLPEGALLALSPASGTVVTSLAVLVRGTIQSGARLLINDTETEADDSGDFLVAVAIAPGANAIEVVAIATDGTRTTRTLAVIGDR